MEVSVVSFFRATTVIKGVKVFDAPTQRFCMISYAIICVMSQKMALNAFVQNIAAGMIAWRCGQVTNDEHLFKPLSHIKPEHNRFKYSLLSFTHNLLHIT